MKKRCRNFAASIRQAGPERRPRWTMAGAVGEGCRVALAERPVLWRPRAWRRSSSKRRSRPAGSGGQRTLRRMCRQDETRVHRELARGEAPGAPAALRRFTGRSSSRRSSSGRIRASTRSWGIRPLAARTRMAAANVPSYPLWLKELHAESHGNTRTSWPTSSGASFDLLAEWRDLRPDCDEHHRARATHARRVCGGSARTAARSSTRAYSLQVARDRPPWSSAS